MIPPGMVSARRPARRRGLLMTAAFLSLSGFLRISGGIGHALAETPNPAAVPAEAPAETTAETTGATCTADGGAGALLEALQARAARIRGRELALADEEQALARARAGIEEKLAALTAAEEKLAAALQLADQAAEKDVARLVAMYEAMKPKDAARLFGEMDPDFAAGFLVRMRPEAAAAVLAGIVPAKAYTISLMLAGRNAAAPKI